MRDEGRMKKVFDSSLIPHPSSLTTMGLLDSEAGKRRLLTVELPVIEAYNNGRDEQFQVRLNRENGALILRYRLKPGHNVYELETRLGPNYPTVPPETRVVTRLRHCPHLLE